MQFRRELVFKLAALCAEEPRLVPRVVRLQAIARGVAVRSFFLRSAAAAAAAAAATSTGEAGAQGRGDAQGLSGQGSKSMEGGMVSPNMSPIASPVLGKGGGRVLAEPPTSPISMHQGALYLKGGGGKGGERGEGGGRPALPEGTPHGGQANGVGGGGGGGSSGVGRERGGDSLDSSAASLSWADSSLSVSPGRGAGRGAGRGGGGGGGGVRSARSPAQRSDGWSPNKSRKSAKSPLRSSSSFSAGLKLPNIPSSAKPILAHVAQVCVCLYLCLRLRLCGVSVWPLKCQKRPSCVKRDLLTTCVSLVCVACLACLCSHHVLISYACPRSQ